MNVVASPPIKPFLGTPWADRGLSDDAKVFRRLNNDAAESASSMAFGEPKRAAQEALYEAYLSAYIDNWDGEGAAKVELSTYAYASQFLQLLPSSVPLPEITADIDGELLFEWDQGRRQIFTVSIGRDGTLTYAGLFGHTKTHGTEHFRETLPAIIAKNLGRLSSSPAS